MKPVIEPYNPAWKAEFQQLKTVLEDVLTGVECSIEHVGSTAVPGLYAKPVIDVDIIIKDASWLGKIAEQLEQLGYINRGDQGIPGRYAFRQSGSSTPVSSLKSKWQAHHLYVCVWGCTSLQNHLLFRDKLLQSRTLAEDYSRLKQKLLTLQLTKAEYQRQKTAFVIAVLKAAGLGAGELDEITRLNS